MKVVGACEGLSYDAEERGPVITVAVDVVTYFVECGNLRVMF